MAIRFGAANIQATLIACAALLLGNSVLADERGASKWFRYGAGIEQNWQVTPDPARLDRIVISPKGDRSGAAKRVLVMYPRPSSAYDIAITKILQVFQAKSIDTELTISNFEMDDQRGRQALRSAENQGFDLIFGMGSESTAWLYDNYRGGAVPVVSVCSKDPVQLGQMKDYTRGSN